MRKILPEDLKRHMARHRLDQYTLLDVRQEWEYGEFHIPGAVLLPLPELADRTGELDPSRPVYTYCRSGGRSKAAAMLLDGLGFEASSLDGGVDAWEGEAAVGPQGAGMFLFDEVRDMEGLLLLAWGLEDRLERFYQSLANLARDEASRDLFRKLAGFELRHKDAAYALYVKGTAEPLDRPTFERKANEAAVSGGREEHLGERIEGGISPEELLAGSPEDLSNLREIVEFAMAVEAQALDFYMRCRDKARDADLRAALMVLASEEKAHLRVLGKYYDERPE